MTVSRSAPPALGSWLQTRSTGVLLHPTSLPSDQGVGVLDGAVDGFLAFLEAAGIRYWQICPLGHTGFGDSPYQCFSAFAGNPYLIDLRALVEAGLLDAADLAPLHRLPRERVDYGALYDAKWPVLFKAHASYVSRGRRDRPYGDFAGFLAEQRTWLEPYALFLAIKDHFQGAPWWEWPAEVRFFRQAQGSRIALTVADRAEAYAFLQYLFFGQWRRVRAQASRRGVEIIGDAPIFVAGDGADVWAEPELFQLDPQTGRPLAVAGVPPDYFSADGQLWGNPLYAWDAHAADDYAWWRRRLQANLDLCDVIRIDHFRGFDTYWSIPANAPNARTGCWKAGPGLPFFEKIRATLPECRLIAEDLGELSPGVVALREATGLPGMTILQFAFGGGADNLYLPHNLRANSVVYPGTHDNDTSKGWYASAPEEARDHVRRYFRIDGREIAWDFIRAAYAVVSNLAVLPAQDLLSLGAEARFNVPGRAGGNWQWRCTTGQIDRLRNDSAAYLRELGMLYGRITATP